MHELRSKGFFLLCYIVSGSITVSLLLSNVASLCASYQRLLQTIVVLEAQRTQAIHDLETLARHQRGALADPISFVDQLQKQVMTTVG